MEVKTKGKYEIGTVEQNEIRNIIDGCGNSTDVVPVLDQKWWPLDMLTSGFIPDQRTYYKVVKTMPMRNDDVLICSFPKSGTHWVWEISQMLIKGKAKYEPAPKEVSMLDFHLPEELEHIPSPRVLNTHYEFNLIPNDVIDKNCKIIYIERNPKDVAVSFYNHLKNNTIGGFTGSWNDYLTTFLSEESLFFNWFSYTRNWEKALSERKDLNILYLTYENISLNPIQEITKMAKFLQVDANKQLINEISKKCSFLNLKKAHEELKHDQYGNKPNKDKKDFRLMYRKGIVGDWKNWFTVKQNELFESYFDKMRPNSLHKYTYVLPTDVPLS